MEPVTFDPPQSGYLAGVAELCRQCGALLVFDEIIIGLRIHLSGAQACFGVTPDPACFGKAMVNGFPLSAIVGRGRDNAAVRADVRADLSGAVLNEAILDGADLN
jgi:glutamate-1-semialdehyde aminotransferase